MDCVNATKEGKQASLSCTRLRPVPIFLTDSKANDPREEVILDIVESPRGKQFSRAVARFVRFTMTRKNKGTARSQILYL